MNPKVSVCITTYNQEKFISQALDSVLMQKTDFDFEVLIGEDDSLDGTREIVKEYARRYSGKIRLFLNDRKNVIYINRRPTGRWNFINNIKNARGEYIALLDGDDFWIDPCKLQKQVDFLTINPSYSTCIHNVNVVYEDLPTAPHPHFGQQATGPHTYPEPNQTSTLMNLMYGNFIPTPSVIFRSGIFNQFPPWFYRCSMGDWPLHVLNSRFGGPIGYLDEIMAVYRVHDKGIWSSVDAIENLLKSISSGTYIKRVLSAKYRKKLERTIVQWHKKIIKLILKEKKFRLPLLLEYKFFLSHNFFRAMFNLFLSQPIRSFISKRRGCDSAPSERTLGIK